MLRRFSRWHQQPGCEFLWCEVAIGAVRCECCSKLIAVEVSNTCNVVLPHVESENLLLMTGILTPMSCS